MMRFLIFLISIICFACVESYKFVVKNSEPSLVVEGYISDVSFTESLDYPSDGRYFTVKLRFTSDVINIKDEVVSSASVNLLSDAGEKWYYTESLVDPGTYVLEAKDFKAVKGVSYKLQITLPEDKVYESDWEKMHNATPEAMGPIGIEEVEKQKYEVVMDEKVVVNIKEINVFTVLPRNESPDPAFYRWDFTPTWIYIAPLAFSSRPGYKCWTSNRNYLASYTLQADYVGGYRKNLFFLEVDGNERIFEDFSVLIRQFSMTEDLYYFWQEMQEQAGSEGLFDNPPYNLKTNIWAVDKNEKVSGYFGVVGEKATRWYFKAKDLSYYVHNYLKEECLKPYGPPARGEINPCDDCRGYGNGKATLVKPQWWR